MMREAELYFKDVFSLLWLSKNVKAVLEAYS